MTDPSPMEQALLRLDGAIRSLESSIDGQSERIQAARDLEDALHQLGLDRSRLAQSLDKAESRSDSLEEVNREVSRRLVDAMDAIRDVLAGK
ncbi:MAG: DUF4164 domain-containing protein [Alphaproteobacteria bacterium]